MPLVPDGRTVLTDPEALNSCNDSVRGRGGICRLSYRLPTRSRRSTGSYERRSRPKGHFPTEDAARKLIYLAIQRAERKWRHAFNWSAALRGLKIHFGDRLPD
jgi:hypothetical protein